MKRSKAIAAGRKPAWLLASRSCAAATVIALLLAAATAGAATVRMSDTASVEQNLVVLSDIAAIEASNPVERAKLARTVVGYVPQDASSVTLDAESVKAALADAGVNMTQVTFAGATAARVVRGASAAPKLTWAAPAVETYLRGIEPTSRFTVSDVRIDWIPPAAFLPVVVAVTPKGAVGLSRFDIADQADLSKIVGHVYANVARATAVVVARHRIGTGHAVTGDDVEIVYLPQSDAVGCVSDAASIIGKRLLFGVDAGKPVSERAIESEDAVKRGDEVILAVSKGPLTVSMRTTSLQNADTGDVVRLKKAGGRGEYIGRITGPGRAAPLAGGLE